MRSAFAIPSMLLAATALAVAGPVAASAQQTTLTVMSFNTWGAGANEGKPIDETVAAIKAAGADIIGIQETRTEGDDCTADVCPPGGESRAKAIAEALGFHYYDQTAANDANWSNAILSRYPIGAATANDTGIPIDVNGRTVYAFNLHLDDSPYQPYQLVGIEYGAFPFLKTTDEAIKAAEETRGRAIALFREDLQAAAGADAAFVFGDFNEPSHRDWTEAAAKAGRHPIAVAYPTALAVENEGFVDAFRVVFPDELAKPGFTWTPTTEPTDPEDHHDRIDFVFARAPKLEVLSAGIVGEKAPEADIVVTPWPADHRAVVATVRF
jgi:exodeoxyribonuclease-3